MKKRPKVGDWVYSLYHEAEGLLVGFMDLPDDWGCTCRVLLVGRDTPSPAHLHSLRIIRRAEVDNENL